MNRLCVALLLIVAASNAAHGLDAEQRHGKALVERLCARCHAIVRTGRSPHPDAPPFRTFGESKLYDEDFRQRLQDGLFTIHPDMPTFEFSHSDATAVLNYLRAIQDRKSSK